MLVLNMKPFVNLRSNFGGYTYYYICTAVRLRPHFLVFCS